MHEELDRVLHQPIRTKIMSYLATHKKELVENKYVTVKKEFIDNKPRTTYSITPKGIDAFLNYVQTLKKIISIN